MHSRWALVMPWQKREHLSCTVVMHSCHAQLLCTVVEHVCYAHLSSTFVTHSCYAQSLSTCYALTKKGAFVMHICHAQLLCTVVEHLFCPDKKGSTCCALTKKGALVLHWQKRACTNRSGQIRIRLRLHSRIFFWLQLIMLSANQPKVLFYLSTLWQCLWSCMHTRCVGLARTVYIRRIWPYIGWFSCQKYRIYTVYIWFWPTLQMCSVFVWFKVYLCTITGI